MTHLLTLMISIWDWTKNERLSRFSNANPLGSRINEARFINEDDQALLLTGSSDGIVRIFRNYDSPEDIELVSAFRALTKMIPSTKMAGLVLDWQQGQGKLIVAGDAQVIKIWDAAKEICTTVCHFFLLSPIISAHDTTFVSVSVTNLLIPKQEIGARSSSPLTSLTTDAVAGNILVAGYGDGALRVFDQRIKPQNAMQMLWKKHKQWITNVHMQRGGLRELVSGCRDGQVKMWDLRWKDEVATVKAVEGGGVMRGLSVHEHAPVFAAYVLALLLFPFPSPSPIPCPPHLAEADNSTQRFLNPYPQPLRHALLLLRHCENTSYPPLRPRTNPAHHIRPPAPYAPPPYQPDRDRGFPPAPYGPCRGCGRQHMGQCLGL